MTYFTLNNIRISGISAVVPPKELLLTDDNLLYNGDEKKIKRVINSSGFLKRRVSDKNVMTSDLCCQAAKTLISDMCIDRQSIDALLFVSYTPDYLMPATSYVLHKRLELPQNCICMDIPQACSGYIIGLFQAGMLINSGCKKVLLLVGDSFSKFTDLFRDHTAPVFGDAGTATLLEYDNSAAEMYFSIMSYSNNYDALMCNNGGFKKPPTQNDFYENGQYTYNASMDGGRVFEFTMNEVTPSIKHLLNYANLNIENIDEYIFHQANKFILENIARQLNIDAAKISTETLTAYGNQCGASIPCTIANVYREKITSQKFKCLLSGFGVGLSVANAIVNFDKIYCTKLVNYNGATRNE